MPGSLFCGAGKSHPAALGQREMVKPAENTGPHGEGPGETRAIIAQRKTARRLQIPGVPKRSAA